MPPANVCVCVFVTLTLLGLHRRLEKNDDKKVKRSETTHVAISRGVPRYKLALRDSQAARGRREEEEGGLLPMAWGWNVDARSRTHVV